MSDTAATRRQLKIKAGVAKRLAKEHKSYQKEEEEQKIKLDKLAAGDGEEWYVKNASNMLQENQKMIADTANRLGDAVQSLRELIILAEKDPALTEDPDFLNAKEIIEEVSA